MGVGDLHFPGPEPGAGPGRGRAAQAMLASAIPLSASYQCGDQSHVIFKSPFWIESRGLQMGRYRRKPLTSTEYNEWVEVIGVRMVEHHHLCLPQEISAPRALRRADG